MTDLDATPPALWLPGAGMVPVDQLEARRAIQDYAHDLDLAQDQRNGQWVVVMEGNDGEPFPVFGLGHELPGRDRITELLYKHDVRRHQGKLAATILKRQDAKRKALEADRNAETSVAAEAIEFGFRKQGAHPSPRIFVPGDKS